MKKIVVSLTLAACVILSLLNFGCNDLPVSEVCVMNGYEKYSDLDKILVQDGIQGVANLNFEEKFITQGTASLKLELDYSSEFTDPAMYATKMHYVANRYDDKFSRLENVKEISVDVYNDNDEEFEFYFGVYGEQEQEYLNDGQTLLPNSWNYIRIPVKQWFFEKDSFVKEYRMYINGVSRLEDKQATFYFDNFSFSINSKYVTPTVKTDYENEILSFTSPAHLDMVLVKNAVDAYEFLPHVYIKQSPNVKIGDKTGCLEVSFSRTHAWGDMYVNDDVEFGADNSGYDIVLHESIVKKFNGAKSVSLTCFNPNPSVHDVTLIAKNGKKEYVSRIDLLGGQMQNVTLNLDGEIDYFAIRIGSWNVVDKCSLYLRDLQYFN